MMQNIFLVIVGVVVGLVARPALRLAKRFCRAVLFSSFANRRAPWLWVPFGGSVREIRWRWGYYGRGWLRCEVCGCWVNTCCQPSCCWSEERNGRYMRVGRCGGCEPVDERINV